MRKLGFGLMRLPVIGEDKGNIDKEKVSRMVDLFIERGFQYFDTAWFYHEKCSELAAGECLSARYPRSAFYLADKMPLDLLESGDKPEDYFAKQLEKCRVEYFDYYLIHALKGAKLEKAEEFGLFEFLKAKKAKTARTAAAGTANAAARMARTRRAALDTAFSTNCRSVTLGSSPRVSISDENRLKYCSISILSFLLLQMSSIFLTASASLLLALMY